MRSDVYAQNGDVERAANYCLTQHTRAPVPLLTSPSMPAASHDIYGSMRAAGVTSQREPASTSTSTATANASLRLTYTQQANINSHNSNSPSVTITHAGGTRSIPIASAARHSLSTQPLSIVLTQSSSHLTLCVNDVHIQLELHIHPAVAAPALPAPAPAPAAAAAADADALSSMVAAAVARELQRAGVGATSPRQEDAKVSTSMGGGTHVRQHGHAVVSARAPCAYACVVCVGCPSPGLQTGDDG